MCGGLGHVADDRLPALGNRNIMYSKLFFAAVAMAFEGLELGCVGSRQLGDPAHSAVSVCQMVGLGELSNEFIKAA